ncbi:hypothetical protein RUM44_010728 [Polyplax serrata]|uniref:Chitinase n=1 Tax=Polyplax serrata TaxID=468196 RepID=A0ABR1AN27_POLSC
MLSLKIVIIGLLSAVSTSVSGSKCSQGSDSPHLFCYYKGKIPLEDIDVSNCTHLVFKHAVTKDGDNKLHVTEDAKESLSLVKEAKSDLVTIFTLKLGKNESSIILESESKRNILTKEILTVLQETKFDGVELNIKFTTESNASKDSYAAFVKTLSKSLDSLHRRSKRNGYNVFETQEDDVTTAAYTTQSPKTGTKKTQSIRQKSETSEEEAKEEEEEKEEAPKSEEQTTEDASQEETTTAEATSGEITETAESAEMTESYESTESEETEECDKKFWLVVRLPVKLDIVGKKFDLKTLSRYADILSVPTHKIINENEKDKIYHPSRLMGLSDVYNTDSILDFLLGMGAIKSKIVISIPASVLKFQLKDSEKNTPGSLSVGKPQTLTQAELCSLFKKKNWTLERDEDLTAPYAYSGDTWLAFEDEISVNIKGKYILLRELAGGAISPIDSDVNEEDCTKRPGNGGYLTGYLRSNFDDLGRKPRGLVLDSLQEDIHERAYSSIEAGVKLSEYRIVRVVDHSGAVHVIRRNTKTEFECSRQGYFTHPLGCNKFYRCVKFDQYSDDFTVFEYDCPTGLAFDERWEVCVWPGSLPNGSPCTGSSEIAPVPRSHYKCPSQEGYYGDPENCRWFFACLDHARDGVTPLTAYEFRCPFGLVFNEQKLACDWPWIVGSCGNGGGSGYYGSSSGIHTTTFLNGGNLEASYGQYGGNAEEASFGSFGRGFGTVLKGLGSGGVEHKASEQGAATGYISSPFDGSHNNRGAFASYPDYEISGGRSHNKGGVVLHEVVNAAGQSNDGLQYGGPTGFQQNYDSNGAGINAVYGDRTTGARKLIPISNPTNVDFVPTSLPSSTPFVVRVPYVPEGDKISGHSSVEASHESDAGLTSTGNVYINKNNDNSGYSKVQYSTSLQGSGSPSGSGYLSGVQQFGSQSSDKGDSFNQHLGNTHVQFSSGVQTSANGGEQTSSIFGKQGEYVGGGQISQVHVTSNLGGSGTAFLGSDAGHQSSASFGGHKSLFDSGGSTSNIQVNNVNSQGADYYNGQKYSTQGTTQSDGGLHAVYSNGQQFSTSQSHESGDVFGGFFNGGSVGGDNLKSTTHGFTATGSTISSATPATVVKSTFPTFSTGHSATPAVVTLSSPVNSFTVSSTTPVPQLKSEEHSGFGGISTSGELGNTQPSGLSDISLGIHTTAFGSVNQHKSPPAPTLGPAVVNFKHVTSGSDGEFTTGPGGHTGLGTVGGGVGVQQPISSFGHTSNVKDFSEQANTGGSLGFGLSNVHYGASGTGAGEEVGSYKQTEVNTHNFGVQHATGNPTQKPFFNTFGQENLHVHTQTGNVNQPVAPVVPVVTPTPQTNTFHFQTFGSEEKVTYNQPGTFYNVPPTSADVTLTSSGGSSVVTNSVGGQFSSDLGTTKPVGNAFRPLQGNQYSGIKYTSFSSPGSFDEEKFNSAVSFVQPGTTYNSPGIQSAIGHGSVSNSFSKYNADSISNKNTYATSQPGFVTQATYSKPTNLKSSIHISSPRPFGFDNSFSFKQTSNSVGQQQSEKNEHAMEISIEKQPIVKVSGIEPVDYDYESSSSGSQGSIPSGFDQISFKSTLQQPKLPTTYSTALPTVSVTTAATPVTYSKTTVASTPRPLNTNFLTKTTTSFVTPVPVTPTGYSSGLGVSHVTTTSEEKHSTPGNFNQATGFGASFGGVADEPASGDRHHLSSGSFINSFDGFSTPSGVFSQDTKSVPTPSTAFGGDLGSAFGLSSGAKGQFASTGDLNIKQVSSSGFEASQGGVTKVPLGLDVSSVGYQSNINQGSVLATGFGKAFGDGSQIQNEKPSSSGSYDINQQAISSTGFEGSFGSVGHVTVAPGDKHVLTDTFNRNQGSTRFSGSIGGVSFTTTKPLPVPVSSVEVSVGTTASSPTGDDHISFITPNDHVSFITGNDQVKSFTPAGKVSFSAGTIAQQSHVSSKEAYTTPGNLLLKDADKVNIQQIVEVTPKPVTYQETFPITGQKNVIIQSPEFVNAQDYPQGTDYGTDDLSYDVQSQSGSFGQREGLKLQHNSGVAGTNVFDGEVPKEVKIFGSNQYFHDAKSSGHSTTTHRPAGQQTTGSDFQTQDHQSPINKFNIDVENAKFFGRGSSPLPISGTTKQPFVPSPTSVSFVPVVSDVQENEALSNVDHHTPGSFRSYLAYDGTQNLTNGRVHTSYGNDQVLSINPNIKIASPPDEYILSGQYDGSYQSGFGQTGSGYATGVGNQGDLLGKVSYKMTMSEEEKSKLSHRDEMEQLLDKYSSSFGKVVNNEIYKAKLANAYARGRTYNGASGALTQSSHQSGQYNSENTRERSRGRQYHGELTSDIPATNKYEEYEIEKANGFGSGSSRTSQDLRNLKSDGRGKSVVVVSQTSDANPILVGKLAGQCSCQSNLLELNQKGRKGTVRVKVRKYKHKPSTESTTATSTEGYGSDGIGGQDLISSTVGYDNTPSSIYPSSDYPSSQSNDVVVITPKGYQNEDTNISTKKSQYRGRARFLSQSSNFGDSGSDSFLSPVLASQLDGHNQIDEEPSKGHAGAAYDRYGPGGWRSFDETLQGSIDCKRPGLFRHPKYCNKFYACNWDPWEEKFTLHVFNCPIKLTYDSSISACNWPVGGPACANDNLLV